MDLNNILISGLITLIVAGNGYKKKSLSFDGLIASLFVGFFTSLAGSPFFMVLLTFFLTSSKLTRWKSEYKKKIEAEYKPGGQRNANQVLCNGLSGTLFAIFYLIIDDSEENLIDPFNFQKFFWSSVFLSGFIAHYSTCNGDTWASEIGILSKDDPFLVIKPWKRVPKGTNGGISVIGTIASILGGFVIGLSFLFMLQIQIYLYSSNFLEIFKCFKILFICTFSGFLGSLIDSLLGSLFQVTVLDKKTKKVIYKDIKDDDHEKVVGIDFLNNDLVNFFSALLTSLIMIYVSYYLIF